jgi:hypothetical protein
MSAIESLVGMSPGAPFRVSVAANAPPALHPAFGGADSQEMTDTFIGTSGASDGLIAITDNEVLIANVKPGVAAGLAQALAEGLTTVPGAKKVPFRTLASVSTNKHRDDITFTFGDGRKSESEVATFDNSDVRDQALAAIEKRVKGLFTRTEVQYGLLRAVGIPLLCTAGVLALTWVFAGAAAEIQNGAEMEARRARTAAVASILGFIGPVGTGLAGLIVAGFTAQWTRQRWQKPPLMIRLVRK